MSVSLVTVVKLVGKRAKAAEKSLRIPGISDVDENGQLSRRSSELFERRLLEFLGHWEKPTSVFSSKYIDNETVGSSNVSVLEMVVPDGMFTSRIISSEHYITWTLYHEKALDIDRLKRIGRRRLV